MASNVIRFVHWEDGLEETASVLRGRAEGERSPGEEAGPEPGQQLWGRRRLTQVTPPAQGQPPPRL